MDTLGPTKTVQITRGDTQIVSSALQRNRVWFTRLGTHVYFDFDLHLKSKSKFLLILLLQILPLEH